MKLKRRSIKILAVVLMFFCAFSANINADQNATKKAEESKQKVVEKNVNAYADGAVTNSPRKESYINGIVYQFSAEVKGLQKQAYDLAKFRLDEALQKKYSKPLAIVSDIDATLMDDATYMADIVQRKEDWDNGPWDYYYESVGSTACKPIPGALEFCKYASSKGVELFYITNRDYDKLDLTVEQLKRAGFPNADAKHVQVMNKEGSSNKTERRENVLKTHEVLLYLGDNIGDFTADFKRELGPIERTKLATDEKYYDNWGTKWIVLPNATYGDYVGAAWYNDKKLDANGRAKKIKDLLDYYKFTSKDYEIWYKGK